MPNACPLAYAQHVLNAWCNSGKPGGGTDYQPFKISRSMTYPQDLMEGREWAALPGACAKVDFGLNGGRLKGDPGS